MSYSDFSAKISFLCTIPSGELKMICECERIHVAAFPVEEFPERRHISTSEVVGRVLTELRYNKAGEGCGYILSVTKVISIGKPKPSSKRKSVLVPVKFRFRSFFPTSGETMVGTVHRVLQRGVFLSFGPLKYIYLHPSKMPRYRYVDNAERSFFQREDLSRIEKDVVVRVKVLAVRWSDVGIGKWGFQVMATVDGDSLGPVSLAGDGLDFPCSDLL
ncbi:PREDICTED: DNA-directed RNA polymerase V subunit 7-like [Ipomoea nil]|uniref:DNA-directed RNA polymerase V subunit 7-like n=1 Tax=Ipomoea nil TaxID=35883 RepID=UPI000901EE20|nr:PREDICTED: DNA-directed RNA polymerase V subunit 7-like [Ipomoea nil]